jgi:rRNA maturation RNase YbeY
MITIKNTQRSVKISLNQVKAIVSNLLTKLGYDDFDIGIWFTTNVTIKRYNARYRAKNKPTDILSFAYYTNIKPGQRISAPSPEEKNLGDLIISPEYVATAAQSYHIPFEEHLRVILVHGVCHLLGYNHKTTHEYRAMRRLEQMLLNHLNQKATL